MATIRVNEELNKLLLDTVKHVGQAEPDVVRATVVMIRNGNAGRVAHVEVPETLYKGNAGIVKNYRVQLPAMPDTEFRRILAARCLFELAKPKSTYYRSFAKEAGIATHMPRSVAELEAMLEGGVQAICEAESE